MARELWVLRHAEAQPRGSAADSERRLTARGEEQSRIAGVALARLAADFEAVLFSPKQRARATAELAAAEWEHAPPELLHEHPPLASGFDAAQALDALAAVGEEGRLLVVGHEPDLSRTVGELTGGTVDLKKGGLAVVRLAGARRELVVLMRPYELALIAGVPVLAG